MDSNDRNRASDELAALEEQGWRALSSTGEEAASFYREVLDDDMAMLLPGGLRLTDRDTIIEAMSGQPWQAFALEALQVLLPVPDAGIVSYGVTAQRDGQPEYSALISSTYVLREGKWRMAFHQQTPR